MQFYPFEWVTEQATAIPAIGDEVITDGEREFAK